MSLEEKVKSDQAKIEQASSSKLAQGDIYQDRVQKKEGAVFLLESTKKQLKSAEKDAKDANKLYKKIEPVYKEFAGMNPDA